MGQIYEEGEELGWFGDHCRGKQQVETGSRCWCGDTVVGSGAPERELE